MSSKTKSLRVAVLAGGDSDERQISLKSGQAVANALTQSGHKVLQLDPAIIDLAGVDWSQFDVAFVALHGSFGEDGQVQRILDDAGVRYTGSGAVASRLAFSKSAAKEQFELFGVPTPKYAIIHYNDDLDEICQKAADIGYPLVVKPDTQGSSLGVSIVRSPGQLHDALKACFQFDSFGIIETMIEGTEWTVGLIDLQILPAIKIETDRPFFDWQAKYEDDQTRYIFDADVPKPVMESLERVACNACAAVGTRGLARVDLRLDLQNQPWVLEINTIPGFTDHSLLPKAAARLGIDFATLCDRIVRDCVTKSITAHQHEVQLRPHLFAARRDLTPRGSARNPG